MEEGITTHPMVIHFLEEHNGETQETLFRLLSKHRAALDRQVTESVRIEDAMANPLESLNLKNEWGGSKLPGLLVAKPKGTARKRDLAEGSKRNRVESVRAGIQELSLEENENGAKRLKAANEDIEETEGGKKTRKEM